MSNVPMGSHGRQPLQDFTLVLESGVLSPTVAPRWLQCAKHAGEGRSICKESCYSGIRRDPILQERQENNLSLNGKETSQ